MSSILTREDMEAIRRQNKEKEARLDERKVKNGVFSDKNTYANPDQIKNVVAQKMKWMNWGKEKGRPTTDEEVWHRIAEYWNILAETGEIPHKTDFYAYLNIDIGMASQWRHGKGCSKERQEMMIVFDSMYDSVRDDLAERNLINQVAWIWSSKQWQGYREPVNKVEVTTTTPLDELPDIASVEAKYLSAIPKDALNEPEDING